MISSRLKGDTREIAYALSLFELAHDRKVHPAVRGLLHHNEPAIRQQAIRLLARAGDATVKDEVEALLRDPALEVRTEALLYLTAFDQADPLERIEALGDFEDFSIRAALAAFLARPGRTQNVDAARVLLSKMVEERGEEGRRTRLEAARLLAILPDPNDAQGKPKTCTKCQGADKDKPIVGLVIIKDLDKSGDRYKGGTILDPEDGKVYKAEVWGEDGKLKVRGYLGPFYKTQTWVKAN